MSKMGLAVLSVCVVGVAAAVVFSRFTEPLSEAALAEGSTHAPSASDRGSSFGHDWERALANATSAERAFGDDGPLWDVVRRWMKRGGRTVMDAVAALEGRRERKAWALSLWLESAPAEALTWAGAWGADGERLQVAAIEALAGRDPAGAVAVAGRLDGPVRVDAAKAALRVWAGIDPMAAWRAAQEVAVAFTPSWSLPGMLELHERTERRRALSLAVLDVWVESSGLREPLDAVASTPDANVPPRWVNAVLARWAASAPQDAVAWASSLPPRAGRPNPLLRREALGATLASMAVHWPDLAIQAIEEIGDWQSRERQAIYNTEGYQDVIRRSPTRRPRAGWRLGSRTTPTNRCARDTPTAWRAPTHGRIRRRPWLGRGRCWGSARTPCGRR